MTENDVKVNSWGGKREGAGMIQGGAQLRISKFYTREEKMELLRDLQERAKKDNKVLMYLVDHVFGKARQTIGLDGGEDKPIAILANIVKDKINEV